MLWKVEPDGDSGRFKVGETSDCLSAMPAFVGGYWRRRDQVYVLTAAQLRKAERLIDAGWRSEANSYYAGEPDAWHPSQPDSFWRDELAVALALCPPEPYRCARTMELALC